VHSTCTFGATMLPMQDNETLSFTTIQSERKITNVPCQRRAKLKKVFNLSLLQNPDGVRKSQTGMGKQRLRGEYPINMDAYSFFGTCRDLTARI
jgi:hypothetical protein